MNGSTGTKELRVRCDQSLLEKPCVFVYKIPTEDELKLFKRRRRVEAGAWDVPNPARICKLSVKASSTGDKVCLIQLQSKNQLFGESVLNFYPGKTAALSKLNPVLDSTRFFTLKIKNYSTGEREFVGIGFSSNTDSADFTNCLKNYFYLPKIKTELKEDLATQELEEPPLPLPVGLETDFEIETGLAEGGSALDQVSSEGLEPSAGSSAEIGTLDPGTFSHISSPRKEMPEPELPKSEKKIKLVDAATQVFFPLHYGHIPSLTSIDCNVVIPTTVAQCARCNNGQRHQELNCPRFTKVAQPKVKVKTRGRKGRPSAQRRKERYFAQRLEKEREMEAAGVIMGSQEQESEEANFINI